MTFLRTVLSHRRSLFHPSLLAFLLTAIGFYIWNFTTNEGLLQQSSPISDKPWHTFASVMDLRQGQQGELATKTVTFENLDLERKWSRSVLFIWCGGEIFTFRDYLSARSVIERTYPSRVVFAYKTKPKVSETAYHTWFLELKESTPFWVECKYDTICTS